jgi:hypothetical protein
MIFGPPHGQTDSPDQGSVPAARPRLQPNGLPTLPILQ